MESTNNINECCPELNVALWDDKTIEWNQKKFMKSKVCTLFYMPMNFGGVMTKAVNKVSASQAEFEEGLCLSEHTSMWNMNVYLAVNKEIADVENTEISGKFYCKVYEGPYNNTGKWIKDFEKISSEKGLNISKTYFWYTTCPKCAKKYGKNYVVILGKMA